MFQGKISRNNNGLCVARGTLWIDGLYALEGKAWDESKFRMVPLLRYAKVVYVAPDGDMWYYAEQNNDAMPVVRSDDRKRIYDVMASLGISVVNTDHNHRS